MSSPDPQQPSAEGDPAYDAYRQEAYEQHPPPPTPEQQAAYYDEQQQQQPAAAEEAAVPETAAPEEEEEPPQQEENPELTALKQEIEQLETTLKEKRRQVRYVQDQVEEYTQAGYARKVAEMENMRRARSVSILLNI